MKAEGWLADVERLDVLEDLGQVLLHASLQLLEQLQHAQHLLLVEFGQLVALHQVDQQEQCRLHGGLDVIPVLADGEEESRDQDVHALDVPDRLVEVAVGGQDGADGGAVGLDLGVGEAGGQVGARDVFIYLDALGAL